jgi:hypothetical protein
LKISIKIDPYRRTPADLTDLEDYYGKAFACHTQSLHRVQSLYICLRGFKRRIVHALKGAHSNKQFSAPGLLGAKHLFSMPETGLSGSLPGRGYIQK